MNKMTKILIGVLLGLQVSCNNSDTSNKTADMEKLKIENKGVNIEYGDSKIGDTTLLFIHGWGIDESYFTNQADFFTKKYRVVAVDLPGFGNSGKNRKTWTVEDYGKDISAVLTALDLKKVILVGHSMSGAIVVETALTNPTRIIGVVGVDNFKEIGLVLTPQMAEEWAGFYRSARQDFKKSVSENMLEHLFSPSTNSIVRKRVSDDILMADTTLAIDCLENTDKYPFIQKLKLLNKPLYLINSDIVPTDTLAFRKNNIEYELYNIGTTGHYPMIEKPNEFNLLLQQVIDKIRSK